MADTITRKAARPRLGLLDWAMAALLAGAVGFVLLVVPPNPLPSAPMSGTRLMLAAPVALVALMMAASLLRALNGPAPARARNGSKPSEVASEPLRLRRADAHPDAPARSPILAARELGMPLDEVMIDEVRPATDVTEAENVDFEAEWERPLPGFIDEEMRIDEAEAVAWEAVDAPDLTAPEQIEAVSGEPGAPKEVSADLPFWVPDRETERPATAEPSTPAEDAPMPVPFRLARMRVAAAASEPLDSLAGRLPTARVETSRLDSLVDRFEAGLDQRSRPPRDHPVPDVALDQRLRSALGDLRKMAGRR